MSESVMSAYAVAQIVDAWSATPGGRGRWEPARTGDRRPAATWGDGAEDLSVQAEGGR